MWRRTIVVVMIALLPAGAEAFAADLTLAADGKTDYQIVVPDRSPNESIGECLNQVARLVQTAFKANGFDAPVVSESKRDKAKPAIYLGDTAFARANGVDLARLAGWGYVHKAIGRDVIVAGRDRPAASKAVKRRRQPHDLVATAKGATDFLREYAGTRFLYPDLAPWRPLMSAASVDLLKTPAIEFLPTPTIAVPAGLDVRRTAAVKFNIGHGQGVGFYDLANNRFPLVDDMFGAHTWARAVPPKKYRETHPEYFALIGGKRLLDGHGQYCISNPDVQELMYRDLIHWLDSGYATVSLGQPDGFRPCQCDKCTELYDTGTDWNEKIWIFHRKLAERVLKARPGKHVTIMSYIQTALPPKTFKAFPKNTRIMMTGTNEKDIAPWRDCVVPGGFTSFVYNWCPNLASRYTPMRTPRYVEAQVKRLVANRFQSIYRDGPGALYGLEGPVYYVMGRMFDDAENSQAKDLVHEFCGAAFGKAAPSMLRFYDRLYHGIELYAEYLGTRCPAWTYRDIYGRRHKHLSDPFQLLGFLYTPKLLAALEKDLARAENTAKADKVKTRLALVRREFDYVKDLATVTHLYHAYEIQPDLASRDRLLDAIDARNARIAGYYDARGRTKRDPGWAFTMFPMPGHDANHLRLAYNRYQGPFKSTCLNWDTKAMRQAPLPGAKHLTVKPVTGPVALDAPEWDRTAANVLGGLPSDAKPSRETTLRALYDETSVYLRVESELPADVMNDLPQQEGIEVYIAPSPGREIVYRFTVGPLADSQTDAAMGFIADVMDPRHDRFDPDWNGEWEVETRLEPKKSRWLALLKIPFQTLGVEPPAAETFWRGNFGRVHVAGSNRIERSIWSAAPDTRSMDERAAFGEIVFGGTSAAAGASRPEKNPLQTWRETYYSEQFAVPAEWQKLPDPMPAPLGPWVFRTDPMERGVKERWYATDLDEADWLLARVPAFWAEIEGVGDYQGHAWYRTKFKAPAEWNGRALRLLFAGVDEQAWVYVNGRLVREHTVKSEGKPIGSLWETPFTVDVPPQQLRFGADNVLAVRVRNDLANGGIWRPVLGHALPKRETRR